MPSANWPHCSRLMFFRVNTWPFFALGHALDQTDRTERRCPPLEIATKRDVEFSFPNYFAVELLEATVPTLSIEPESFVGYGNSRLVSWESPWNECESYCRDQK